MLVTNICEACNKEFTWDRRGTKTRRYCGQQCYTATKRPIKDPVIRFWGKVEKTEGCWIWKACTYGFGYGKTYWNGKSAIAHRVAYEIANGPIPDGLNVCHSCDNPQCVNPAHLWTGTHADNIADKFSKGRQRVSPVYGERNKHAKLTNEKVRAIRDRYAAGGVRQEDLAQEYGVDQTTISDIVLRRKWSQVP